jgi:hypothetical protein
MVIGHQSIKIIKNIQNDKVVFIKTCNITCPTITYVDYVIVD